MLKFNDIDKIKFHDYRNKKILITTTEDTPARMQIPRMYMPFGVSCFQGEVGPQKFNLDFSLNDHDTEDSYIKRFYDAVRAIESKVIDEVERQSESIFGEKKTREELEGMFNSNIKLSTGDHPPKFRVKVKGTVDNKMKAEAFKGADRTRLNDELVNGLYSRNSGKAIVELGPSVYFLNRMFGVTWCLDQLLVFEPERLKGFQFQL